MRRETLLALAIALTAARPARADEPPMKPEARALWDQGQALYAGGDFAGAIDRFQKGRAIDPRPEFLYAIGQAQRKAGQCREAIESYRAFIVESKSDKQVEAARLQIDRCERELAARQKPEPPRPHPRPLPPVHRTIPGRSWYRDPIGLSLAGAGVMALGGGGFFLWRSTREVDGATYGAFEDDLAARRRERTAGIALAVTGGALVVSGVVRFWLLPGDTEVLVQPAADGAVVSAAGTLP
jgi:tetratricopeptide (TPR) repeat protein